MSLFPDGVKVFNGTPHPIVFRDEDGQEETIPSHGVINATIGEVPYTPIKHLPSSRRELGGIEFVSPTFSLNPQGMEVIGRARAGGYTLIVGSIIAAQAYPGVIVAMCAADGYERVPPDQTRMNPRKFMVY